MTVGVISHLGNPDFDDVRRLASIAEASGADWLGLPDAFWWRDTWLLAAEAARVTTTLVIGPVVTNPYLRHPFLTVAAVATLQDVAGPRVQLGLAAGGSEVTAVAGVRRDDAPERVAEVVSLVRRVATGAPFLESGGLRLEVPLARPTVLVAGRAQRLLEVAGRVADRVLLWSVPFSDLERSAAAVRAARGRRTERRDPELVWAPAVAHDERTRQSHVASLPYAVLNSRPRLQRGWGVDGPTVGRIRELVVAGDLPGASTLVPPAARDDFILPSPDPDLVAERARAIRATSLAVPVFRVEDVRPRVEWARRVLAAR